MHIIYADKPNTIVAGSGVPRIARALARARGFIRSLPGDNGRMPAAGGA